MIDPKFVELKKMSCSNFFVLYRKKRVDEVVIFQQCGALPGGHNRTKAGDPELSHPGIGRFSVGDEVATSDFTAL